MANILTSLHGRLLGLTGGGRLMCPMGFVAGRDGSQFDPIQPDRLRVFDDFDGAVISSKWTLSKGSDGSAANFAITPSLNGRVQGSTGAGAGATMAVNGLQISGALNFQANSGGCSMQARVQASAITTFAIFIGFTNQAGTLQMPVIGSGTGNGLTNNAADCVGVLYDTTMTNANWWLVGDAASTGAAAQNSGLTPVAATDDIWRIDLDTSGNATFFHGASIAAGGGLQAGVKMPAAVTATVPLTPVIACFRRSAAAATVAIDYIFGSCIRV